MRKKNGQAALDFLMTYGWALLIVALGIGAIYSLGVFDLGTFVGSRATGFAQIGVTGWTLSSAGAFTIKFRNNAGTDINITRVNVTYLTQNLSYANNVTVLNGDDGPTISVGSFGSTANGGSYSSKVTVEYLDVATGNRYVDMGNLYGRIV